MGTKKVHISGRYTILAAIITATATVTASIVNNQAQMKYDGLKKDYDAVILKNKELSESNTTLTTENEELIGENEKLSYSKTELQKENKKLVSDAEIQMEGIRVLLKNIKGIDYTGKDIKIIETDNEITFVTGDSIIVEY